MQGTPGISYGAFLLRIPTESLVAVSVEALKIVEFLLQLTVPGTPGGT